MMKTELWLVGKTKETWAIQAMDEYTKRCRRYTSVTINVIADARQKQAEIIRRDESDRILHQLKKAQRAYTILLDEAGVQMSSREFADAVAKQQSQGVSILRFIIGGAYGVDDRLREEADLVMSLSALTFPHQLVRVLFMEQLYRAFTILRGEGYHHA